MLKNLRKVLFYFFSFLFVFTGFSVSVFFFYGRDLPSENILLSYSPPTTTKIYSSSNKLMDEYAFERRVIVPFEKIPILLKGAFIVAEDREFYSHSGISFQSLMRAIIENTAKKSWGTKPAGGSTITQQVAKNLLVGNKRSIERKIKEAIMAFRIEFSIPKDKILEIYLNQIYLGKGCYGIVEACEYYFGKTIDKITPEEAAFIASLPSAPSVYTNLKDNSKVIAKRNAVLYQMYELGYINQEQLKTSLKKKIEMKFQKHKMSSPYFSEEIHRLFLENISEEDFFKSGYIITTTMDEKIQNIAQKSLEDGLIECEKRNKWKGVVYSLKQKENVKEKLAEIGKSLPRTLNKIIPVVVHKVLKNSYECKDFNEKTIIVENNSYKDCIIKEKDIILARAILKNSKYELYQQPSMTGGIVVMDSQTGEILGMSGGYSFDISSFNCVTQAHRQTGSVIKPFVYASAIESGMDEYDIIDDKPVSIKLEGGEVYSPKNYSGNSYGEMPMRDGLIYSRNLATVNLALKVGMKNVFSFLKKFPIVGKKVHFSTVLGATESTLSNVISSFSAITNFGKMVKPKFVKKVKTQSNVKLLNSNTIDFLCKTKYKKVCSKETALTIKNMLRDAIKFGTGSRISNSLKELNIDFGGKTGTTNDFKDAWFVGFITNSKETLLIGVFVGYAIPKSIGEHASGAKIALPIFCDFVKNYCKN